MPFADIDECGNSNSCGKNTKCKNYLGGYYCVCELGFETENGKTHGHNLICDKGKFENGVYYSVIPQVYSEKGNPSAPIN